jgi:transcription-repair coupling factor (superfamily II helicase)
MSVACGALLVCEGSKNLTHETKKHSANFIGKTYPTFCILNSAFCIMNYAFPISLQSTLNTYLHKLPAFAGSAILSALRTQACSVFGVPFGGRVRIAAQIPGPFVWVASDYFAARTAHSALSNYLDDVAFFPAVPDVLTYRQGAVQEIAAARARTLAALTAGTARAVVTTADALSQLLPPKTAYAAHTLMFTPAHTYDMDGVCRSLTAAGYTRGSLASIPGEYARRGDILDIFSPGTGPTRLEFFGDTLESIRSFDPETQRSLVGISALTVPPCAAFFAENAALAAALAALTAHCRKLSPPASDRLQGIISDIELCTAGGGRACNLAYLAPLLPHATLADYLPADTVMVYDEVKLLVDTLRLSLTEHRGRVARLLEAGEIAPFCEGQMLSEPKTFAAFAHLSRLAFFSITAANPIFTAEKLFNPKAAPITKYAAAFAELVTDVRRWLQQGFRVAICAGDAARGLSLQRALSAEGVTVPYAATPSDIPAGGGCVLPVALDAGFCFLEEKLAVVGSGDLHPKRATLRAKGKDAFMSFNVGDYVVHEAHGIGRNQGVKQLGGMFGERDYFVIEYAQGDILYVPTDQADMLSLFSGGEPRPTRLGGGDFAKTIERVKAGLKALAVDLQALYAARSQATGVRYDIDEGILASFSESFGHTETDDQLSAVNDIKRDMAAGKVMDRLLCGDVGYGKTEVAFRAAFLTMLGGRQVAILAPTTILTEQHYNTAAARFAGTGVRIGCLNRFRSPKEQAAVLAALAAGELDMVIGTHRLLSKDVHFSDLGLLVLDEEQRFGVAHKEKIKQLKGNVNVLTLTATPIPRTLHLSLSGIRDISVLETPPAERLPVQTYVTEFTEATVVDAVMREVARGGQAFVVHNRVETIDGFAARLQRLLPKQVRVVVGHAQMDEVRLENVVKTFYDGDADVLVATMIIENGVDLPRANTLIVDDADDFGLAQLYQLRGRVGRSNRLAYAYFCYRGVLSDGAYKRLNTLLEYTELGSGFKIAMRDMEIRGAGNVLGREQHGHMEKVGYELYCKLLAQSVAELSGTAAPPVRECRVDIDEPAHLPRAYIEDETARMRFYSRTAALKTEEERAALLAEVTQIYGKPPRAAAALILLGHVKCLGQAAGCKHIALAKTGCVLTFYALTPALARALSVRPEATLRAKDSTQVHIPPPRAYERTYAFLQEMGKEYNA